MLARLRIAGSVSAAVARLATSLASYSVAGRVLHPPDDSRNFMKSSHPSLLSDQPCLVARSLLVPLRRSSKRAERVRSGTAIWSRYPRPVGRHLRRGSPRTVVVRPGISTCRVRIPAGSRPFFDGKEASGATRRLSCPSPFPMNRIDRASKRGPRPRRESRPSARK